jgi:DinB superfamily
MPRPDLSRVPSFYHKYINLVKEDELMTAFTNQSASLFSFFNSIPEAKHDYAYGEGKWTVKELLQHMLDAERVFVYRALTFSRKDENKLPGFDENEWAPESNAAARNWNEMVEEFKALRKSTELMFGSFNSSQLDSTGIANNNLVYVSAIGFIIIGHCNHHIGVLKERYL